MRKSALFRRGASAVARVHPRRSVPLNCASQVVRRFSAHEGRGQFAAGELLTITSLLDSPISAQLQAALYGAAALVPGTRYDGTTYDLSHRAGVGI